jgi:hypothetical protein
VALCRGHAMRKSAACFRHWAPAPVSSTRPCHLRTSCISGKFSQLDKPRVFPESELQVAWSSEVALTAKIVPTIRRSFLVLWLLVLPWSFVQTLHWCALPSLRTLVAVPCRLGCSQVEFHRWESACMLQVDLTLTACCGCEKHGCRWTTPACIILGYQLLGFEEIGVEIGVQ